LPRHASSRLQQKVDLDGPPRSDEDAEDVARQFCFVGRHRVLAGLQIRLRVLAVCVRGDLVCAAGAPNEVQDDPRAADTLSRRIHDAAFDNPRCRRLRTRRRQRGAHGQGDSDRQLDRGARSDASVRPADLDYDHGQAQFTPNWL
jgi:hypothetical protein